MFDFSKPLDDAELEAGAMLKALAHSSAAGVTAGTMQLSREWASTFPMRARRLVKEAAKLAPVQAAIKAL